MNDVRFEFAENKEEISAYFNDSSNEHDAVDYIVFRMPVGEGYEVYDSNGENPDHFDTFDELCNYFIGDGLGM